MQEYRCFKGHIKFLSSCLEVKGKVIDIVEVRRYIKDSFGAVTDVKHTFAPVVEYTSGKHYRFQSEINAKTHSINIGDSVVVQLQKNNNKIAKLKAGNNERMLMGYSGIILGFVALLMSAYSFESKH